MVAPIVGRLTLAVALAVLAMYCFINLAYEVPTGEIRQFDVAVLEFFREQRQPLLRQLMWAAFWLGGPLMQPGVVAVCIAGLVVARRFWPDGLTVFVAAVGGGALMYGLKRLFQRPRPEVMFDHPGYSFPSGRPLLRPGDLPHGGVLAGEGHAAPAHVWPPNRGNGAGTP